ncbi:MAG: hypothetical protein IIB44_12905 [Candidatus Marinimicrobia bacterium]|nr:hypothetical protein [Candidatus Neomarinimicrobiota bacterium]
MGQRSSHRITKVASPKALGVLFLLIMSGSAFAASGDNNDPANASGTNWTNPDSVYASDDARATYTNIAQDTLFVTDFTIGAASGATIDSIVVSIEGHGTAGNSARRTLAISLTKDGTNKMGDVVTLTLLKNTDTAQEVTGSTNGLWGVSWTDTEINASTFGVIINNNNTTADEIRIDHVQVKVFWTGDVTAPTIIQCHLQGYGR